MTSAGSSSPTPVSCMGCRPTSPSSWRDTATSTSRWDTRPSIPKRSSTATGRSSPGAAPCGQPRNTARPPKRNGPSSSATSNAAGCRWAPAAALTAHPASTSTCIRCPLLRPDPAQRPRLTEIHDNLLTRIEEAHREGWAGEAEGLKVSLAAARQKLAQMSEISARHRDTAVYLGMPAHPGAASRATTAPALPGKEPS